MKSTKEKLNHAFIEFYEKFSAWELDSVKNSGLSLTLVHAVEILGAFGAMPMKKLAEKVGVTTGTLTVQVDKLVDAGLVQRIPQQTDRRSIFVGLSEKGRALFAEHDNLHLQLTTQLTASFSDKEISQLLSLFDRMNTKF
ncbi:MarR family winged helix-turn-helix transcriptional regulator [Psychromonas antarctica]|uniref:MarR family winged helix-turn-helix transcriptional regulator n=1 Tax=Psychromonas antarctica TaxID=67573 RepID=UPI001EE8A9B7|nr:MarR family transcriptional regulator [Psychromonas antarctica]MCG6200755.1 MarR family transcriptional regulator [Psychromonas antarctica]